MGRITNMKRTIELLGIVKDRLCFHGNLDEAKIIGEIIDRISPKTADVSTDEQKSEYT